MVRNSTFFIGPDKLRMQSFHMFKIGLMKFIRSCKIGIFYQKIYFFIKKYQNQLLKYIFYFVVKKNNKDYTFVDKSSYFVQPFLFFHDHFFGKEKTFNIVACFNKILFSLKMKILSNHQACFY